MKLYGLYVCHFEHFPETETTKPPFRKTVLINKSIMYGIIAGKKY